MASKIVKIASRMSRSPALLVLLTLPDCNFSSSLVTFSSVFSIPAASPPAVLSIAYGGTGSTTGLNGTKTGAGAAAATTTGAGLPSGLKTCGWIGTAACGGNIVVFDCNTITEGAAAAGA